MAEITQPVEGCTRCWCGAKYWDQSNGGYPSLITYRCHSCGELFRPWHYILDEEGIPQVTLDGVSLVW